MITKQNIKVIVEFQGVRKEGTLKTSMKGKDDVMYYNVWHYDSVSLVTDRQLTYL